MTIGWTFVKKATYEFHGGWKKVSWDAVVKSREDGSRMIQHGHSPGFYTRILFTKTGICLWNRVPGWPFTFPVLERLLDTFLLIRQGPPSAKYLKSFRPSIDKLLAHLNELLDVSIRWVWVSKDFQLWIFSYEDK